MRGMARVFFLMVVGFSCFATAVETASAQSIIRAIYRVSLADPATGNYTMRIAEASAHGLPKRAVRTKRRASAASIQALWQT